MVKIEKGFKNERLGLELDIYEDNGKEWFKANAIAEFFIRDNSSYYKS